MSTRVYCVPGGRRESFMEWTNVDLSSKLLLTCGSNVSYHNGVHHPIPTLPDGIGKSQAIFKTNQLALLPNDCSDIFSSWPKWERERKVFLRGCKKGGHIVRLPTGALGCHKRWKVSHFVKFEIILPLFFLLLGTLTNKHCRTWSSMMNL